MKRLSILAGSIIAVLFLMVGCGSETSPTVDKTIQKGSTQTSSEVISSSSDTVSSEAETSSASIRSDDVSSVTESEKESLTQSLEEYTVVMGKTVYPIGTTNIALQITNNGAENLMYSSQYKVDKFDGSKWVCLNEDGMQGGDGCTVILPDNMMGCAFGTDDILSEAGKYRLRLNFSHGEKKNEEKTFEFTVE